MEVVAWARCEMNLLRHNEPLVLRRTQPRGVTSLEHRSRVFRCSQHSLGEREREVVAGRDAVCEIVAENLLRHNESLVLQRSQPSALRRSEPRLSLVLGAPTNLSEPRGRSTDHLRG